MYTRQKKRIFSTTLSVLSLTTESFVDIGAAIGYYPLLAKRLAPRLIIHAVEPLSATNGLSPADFIIHKEAIYSAGGNQRVVDRGYGTLL